MAHYLMLFRFTEKGITRIKESPARIEAARELIGTMGGRVKEFYSLMGKYDSSIVLEAPDDETASRIALAICSLGNVRTETLRAYTEEEYRGMVAKLP